MTQTKVLLSLLLSAAWPLGSIAQEIKVNLFVRSPQVINYDLSEAQLAYNPVMSLGLGLSHKGTFLELATLISDDDLYGYYTFFGTRLGQKALSQAVQAECSWFGELSYTPNQPGADQALTYTSGLCYVISHRFETGAIGLPLCLGGAYSQSQFSLNARAVINLSINLF